MKNFRKTVCWALVLMMLVSLTACAQKPASESVSKATSSERLEHYFDSCTAALTLTELCEQCPTVVYGTNASIDSVEDVYPPEMPPFVRTTFSIDVKDSIQGKSSDVHAYFMGGETENQIYLPISGKLPQVGDQYIFFIFEGGSFYPGFQVRDGMVVIENFIDSKLFKEDGKPQQSVAIKDLIAELREMVG